MKLRTPWRLPSMSPLLRLTLALVSLCALLVVLADLMLGLFPDREQQRLQQRRPVAELLAGQVAAQLRDGKDGPLAQTLQAAVVRVPRLRQALLRSADGAVVAYADRDQAPPAALPADAGDVSSSRALVVPLLADGRRWGRLELHFDDGPHLAGWLRDPLLGLLLTISLLGTPLLWLYLRRALRHLDPSSVIPERVQGAFDVMNEGVVVLDVKGRVLLANKAWQRLQPAGRGPALGQPLSAQAWLTAALPADAKQHPWMATLNDGVAVSGVPLQVPCQGAAQVDGEAPGELQLLVNTMPITDSRGAVRGCLVSFGDLSELHRAHAAQQQAMAELQASQAQVQRQNEELHRLATRDPLTGCLNRRAFNAAWAQLFEAARSGGEPLSCLILDIDHFKKVNDTHGHGIGDRVIEETARKLNESARAGDLVCRWGGEEFVVALPGLDGQAALRVAERVRARVEAECGLAVREVPGLRVTVSLGVAALDPYIDHAAQMVDAADQALYQAKRGGRNRAVLAGSEAAAMAPV